jgi:hypothetical protein
VVAIDRMVTPAQATSASSSMSPELLERRLAILQLLAVHEQLLSGRIAPHTGEGRATAGCGELNHLHEAEALVAVIVGPVA